MSEFQKYGIISDMNVDFPKPESSSKLKGILLPTGFRGVLEGKDYRVSDIVFPFAFQYVETGIEFQEYATLTYIRLSIQTWLIL